MSRTILFALCLFSSLLLLACSKSENANMATPASSSNSNSSAARSTPPGTTSSAGSSAGEKVGIPACDDFLEKYEACVTGKVPASARDQYTDSLAMMRKQWKQLSGNPQTRGSLEMACKSAAEQATAQMKAYNCTF